MYAQLRTTPINMCWLRLQLWKTRVCVSPGTVSLPYKTLHSNRRVALDTILQETWLLHMIFSKIAYISWLFSISCSMPWVEIEGTIYRREGVVVTESLLVPDFAVVEDIVVTDKMQCYLICKECDTLQFHSHYHSYEIRVTPSLIVVRPNELADHHLLSLQCLPSFSGSFFVCMKYHIIENV